MKCVKCSNEFSNKRAMLGYKTCIKCGEKEAQKEIHRRKKCIAIPYNKGTYQYIYSLSEVKDLGK